MNWISVVGYGAALCSTVSFVPQAWRVLRTRDVSALSAPTYTITCCGFALWLVYGLAKAEWPLILTNGICLVLASFILAMKLMPRTQRESVAQTLAPPAD
ncbi:MAG TPA: SemiSWEET transporter [Bosea sp. (in: a-proteobacteria)]|uniref:SemiSWEET family sugar transporter n=1 Tax=Bosea sp. (in: a-proteobacteria) TaxID=1871050 RepID=UPI002DDD37E4|nr:SemiSWEET transporter [Bosea sp. (in: a-proteobacteria)]HEV2553378.1 SemiSWEET transporter [Bosea sp. (in: a-proteobacteria)]